MITMDIKKLFLETEGDAYYQRNKNALTKDNIGEDINFYSSFFSEMNILNKNTKFVEIGASNGHNLKYFKEKFECEVFGIDPSSEATKEGNKQFFNNKKVLLQGTSDSLPYDDESTDIVMFGFSLFWVGRKYLYRSISEADRILKEGGYLLITDFDTPLPYKRDNIHNKDTFTCKMNYSKFYLCNPQYSLICKKNYSHESNTFNKDIQERVSAQILYKDYEDNSYIFE